MRKPNYGFERSERNKAREAKIKEKEQKKQDRKTETVSQPPQQMHEIGPEDEERGPLPPD
jgi:hypothetical protein